MSKTCETCRHYSDGMRPGEKTPGFHGECKMAESCAGEPDAPTLALAIDAAYEGAGLLVSKRFGCVQWQAK